jgi:PKD repeat protein
MKKVCYLLNLLILVALASCQKTPTASFTTSTTSPEAGEIVRFNNTSENGESYNWDFGDGGNSTQENPEHTFSNEGTYSISLEVLSKNGKKKDIATSTITVSKKAATLAPVANFSYSPTVVFLGGNVAFADESTNSPTTWNWVFGDGTSSNIQNPTHIYNAKGNYTVSLTAANSIGNNTHTKNFSVVNQSDALQGLYNVTDVIAGQTFNYTNTITPSTTINNRITVNKFGDYVNAIVYFDISGSNVTIPSQTITCGNPEALRTFSGNGTISGTTISMSYTEATNGSTANGNLTYQKQ